MLLRIPPRRACLFLLLFILFCADGLVLAAPEGAVRVALQEAAQAPLATPGGVTARASFVKGISLSWQPVDEAAGYTIEKSATGVAGSFIALTTVPAEVNYYRESGLGLSEQVYYRVKATADGLESGYSAVVSATTGPDDIVRIMPLGDSNTEGHAGGLAEEERIGYRKELYRQLVLDGRVEGYKIDFVGSQQMGQSHQAGFLEENGFALDIDHAGFGGARDEDIHLLLRDGIFPFYTTGEFRGPGGGPYLDNYNPDILLLHIGTNQVDGGENAMNDVKNVLDQVDVYEARSGREVTVIVAKIIRRVCNDTDCLTPIEATNTLKYNEMLAKYVTERKAAGDRLHLVDMQDMQEGDRINYRYTYQGGDMADNLHPAQSGYDKMARVWFGALKSPSIPLPVELVEFRASYSQMEVQLNWSTAVERGNSHFVVERMQEGQPFTAVGTVAGAGNSGSLLRYTYTDANAPAGLLYYRLKQVDEDGAYTYSNVIAVERAVATALSAKVYPNPSDGAKAVYLLATGFAGGARVEVTLFAMAGKKLYHQKVRAGSQGELHASVQLPFSLPRGLYIWELTSSGSSQKLKLLVR